MKQTLVHLLIILIVAGSVFFTNLGVVKLWDRDEPRNAGCALEMMERGNFIVPTFNDELRHQKPALLYWLIASAYSVFGVNEFAARFWSALLAIGTVLATYGIAMYLFNRVIALISTVILATSLMFVVAARAATPDSALIFFSTLAVLVYVKSVFGSAQQESSSHPSAWFPQKRMAVFAMYALMGLGVLAKGPVGFLLPMAIIGMFMLLARLPVIQVTGNRVNIASAIAARIVSMFRPFAPRHFIKTLWAMKPVSAAAIILLVAAPWYIAVGVQTEGEWLRRFFFNEHLGRATNVLENHSGGPWFFPMAILLGFFPWSVFAAPVVLYCRNELKTKRSKLVGEHQTFCRPNARTGNAAITFLCCWICVQVGLFTLASTKLPSYVTPCYPALAILTAAFLYQFAANMQTVSKFWPKVSTCCLILSGVAITIAVSLAAARYLPGEEWLAVLGVIPMIGGLLAFWFLINGQSDRWIVSLAATAFLFAVALFGFATVAVDQHQQNDLLLSSIRQASPRTGIASFGSLESSWVFYGGRPVLELVETSGATTLATRRHFWQKRTRVTPAIFLAAHPHSLIIASESDIPRLRKLVSEREIVEVKRTKYFLKDTDLVLLRFATDRWSERDQLPISR